MKRLFLLGMVFFFARCSNNESSQYSDEFVKYIDSAGFELTGNENHGFTLHGDSIVHFSNGKTRFIASIATGLYKGQVYSFKNQSETTLEIKRLNFTNLEIKLHHDENTIDAIATMTKDVLRLQYEFEQDSVQIKALAFEFNFDSCKCLLLLSKELKEYTGPKVLLVSIDDGCKSVNDSLFRGTYHELIF